MPLPAPTELDIPKPPTDAPADVLRFSEGVRKFLLTLLRNIPTPGPPPPPPPPPAQLEYRAGYTQITKNAKQTKIEFAKEFPSSSDYTLAITEWRNEPSDTVKLNSLYIMLHDAKSFTIGHQVFTGTGDAPTFGWIAIRTTQ